MNCERPIIVNFDLSLENLSNEIFKLISPIRPDWNSSNTRLVRFSEGITNSITGLFDTRTGDDRSTGLVIKLFGAHTELFIDRQAEFEAMIKLAREGVLSQKVLIEFNNGIIYEFATGRACSREQVRTEHVAQLIATKLAQLHSVSIENIEKPYVMTLCKKFIELINQYQQSTQDFLFKQMKDLINDVNVIEQEILPKLVPNAEIGKDLVICHNDLLVKNLVYDDKHDKISFIDFEYTHLNYYLFDIANHFVEYAGVDDADFSLYPDRNEQKRWLKFYFQIRPIENQSIDDDLCHRIDQFSALSHLMWGLWALLQSNISLIDFDYVQYAKLRLGCYYKLRPILFESIQQN